VQKFALMRARRHGRCVICLMPAPPRLRRSFFDRSVHEVAPELIGATLLFNGAGGTIAGASTFLREKKKDIVIGVADPRGAAMYHLFKEGQVTATEGGSITEGIGLGRVTPIIDGLKVDKSYLIPDEEALPLIFDLLEHEGLCLGGSSGINVAGAIRLAKDLGPGKTIVTILADYGTRYQSKLFNPDFLRSKKLPVPDWLERKSNIKPPFEKT